MTSPPPPALVTYEDVDEVSDEPSAPDTVERRRLVVFCKRAQAEIRSKVPTVDVRIGAGSLDKDLVTGVAVDMVLAALEDLMIGFRVVGDVYPESETRYAPLSSQARSLIRMTPEQVSKLAPPDTAAGMYTVLLGGT